MIVKVWEYGNAKGELVQRQRDVEPLSEHTFTYSVPIGGNLLAWIWVVETQGQYFEMGRVNSRVRIEKMTFHQLIRNFEKRIDQFDIFSKIEVKFAETFSTELADKVKSTIMDRKLARRERRIKNKGIIKERMEKAERRKQMEDELLNSVIDIINVSSISEMSTLSRCALLHYLGVEKEFTIDGETIKCTYSELILKYGYNKVFRTDDWCSKTRQLRIRPKRTYTLQREDGQSVIIDGHFGKWLKATSRTIMPK